MKIIDEVVVITSTNAVLRVFQMQDWVSVIVQAKGQDEMVYTGSGIEYEIGSVPVLKAEGRAVKMIRKSKLGKVINTIRYIQQVNG